MAADFFLSFYLVLLTCKRKIKKQKAEYLMMGFSVTAHTLEPDAPIWRRIGRSMFFNSQEDKHTYTQANLHHQTADVMPYQRHQLLRNDY